MAHRPRVMDLMYPCTTGKSKHYFPPTLIKLRSSCPGTHVPSTRTRPMGRVSLLCPFKLSAPNTVLTY